MKNTCFNSGASLEKSRVIVWKFSAEGAAVVSGCDASRNTPKSELRGALTSDIPFCAPAA
jgi:hypothetical protein